VNELGLNTGLFSHPTSFFSSVLLYLSVFQRGMSSSSLRSPEESWSNRSLLFKLPQNFQTMRLLSLPTLGWPISKEKGSQEEEVIKPFVSILFLIDLTAGKTNGNLSLITFQ
jgi:hypothetical protein